MPHHRLPNPSLPPTLLWLLLVLAPAASAADWRPSEAPWPKDTGGLYYAKREAQDADHGRRVSAHLAFFPSPAYRLEVVDLGAGGEPAHGGLADALRAAGCPAGVNGGFFHADWTPLGLVVAGGRRIHRFETAKLLSGLIWSDDRGTHLVRRSRFRDTPDIAALLQSGPYLVEGARPVRGLSAADPRRRTFVATDWRGRWVLGATETPLTLAELADCLASPGALTPWRVDRALNLDGGSSTGFFFDRGAGRPPVEIEPRKRVRNLLGIRARRAVAPAASVRTD